MQAGFLLVSELFNVVVRSMLRFQDVAELLDIRLVSTPSYPTKQWSQELVNTCWFDVSDQSELSAVVDRHKPIAATSLERTIEQFVIYTLTSNV